MPESPTARILVPLLPPALCKLYRDGIPTSQAEAPVAQLPVLLDPWVCSLFFVSLNASLSLSLQYRARCHDSRTVFDLGADSSVKGNDSRSENNVSLCTSNGDTVNSVKLIYLKVQNGYLLKKKREYVCSKHVGNASKEILRRSNGGRATGYLFRGRKCGRGCDRYFPYNDSPAVDCCAPLQTVAQAQG